MPALNFIGSKDVCYFYPEWLGKANTILGEGMLTKNAGNDGGTLGNEREAK